VEGQEIKAADRNVTQLVTVRGSALLLDPSWNGKGAITPVVLMRHPVGRHRGHDLSIEDHRRVATRGYRSDGRII